MLRNRRGIALLEAIIALAILSLAGTAAVGLLAAGLRSEVGLANRERALRDAERVLIAMTLLTRADLDRRLGRRPVGKFVVEVQRPERVLYRIAVSEAAGAEALVTVVYRPEGP